MSYYRPTNENRAATFTARLQTFVNDARNYMPFLISTVICLSSASFCVHLSPILWLA